VALWGAPPSEGETTESTGRRGAGFIGSHLCAALLERGDDVLCVDNLATGSRQNVEALQHHDRFSFLEHDVCQPLERTIEADFVFHLASPASVPDYLARPLETLRVNSQGTWHLIDLARRQSARFLFTSTSEIYGDPQVHPQVETYWGNVNSIGPRACYDESKRFGEALVTTAVRAQGLDGRVVRILIRTDRTRAPAMVG
jgi:nucleoside-diphosphate-sugar epimerase